MRRVRTCGPSWPISASMRTITPGWVEVWNKVDLLDDEAQMAALSSAGHKPDDARPVVISALTGAGIEMLLRRLEGLLAAGRHTFLVTLDPVDGKGLNWLYEHGEIIDRRDAEDGVIHLEVRVGAERMEQLQRLYPGADALDNGRTRSSGRQGAGRGRAALRQRHIRPASRTAWLVSTAPPWRPASSRRGMIPAVPSSASTKPKRRSNLAFVLRSAWSGSISAWRARLITANSRSPISSICAARVPRVRASVTSFELFLDLGQHVGRVDPVETHRGGFGLELVRTHDGREGVGHVGQQASRIGAPTHGAFGLLGRLDLGPDDFHLGRRQGHGVAEHMRMAPDQLGRDRLHDIAEIEAALLLCHARVEHDLQQEVA